MPALGRRQLARVAIVLTLLPALATGQTQPAPPAANPAPIGAPAPRASSATFSKEQLEQLVAPIALYPDSLLSQVLMAATYPADVAEAAKWSKANKDMKGDAAVQAVQNQPWDPAVQSLAAFPQVLQAMGDQPDWVQNLGDAFLASSKEMLDAVQRLRAKAQTAGNLKSNEQQKVIVEAAAPQQTVIKIEPAQPRCDLRAGLRPDRRLRHVAVSVLPALLLAAVFVLLPRLLPGCASRPACSGASAIGSILWGGCNWGGGDININVDRFNKVNHNRQIDRGQNKFQHNAANRKGVPYRDQASRDKLRPGRGGAEARNNYRGRDPVTESRRQQAQSTLQSRGMDPAQAREQLRNDPATRQRAQAAAQGGDATSQAAVATSAADPGCGRRGWRAAQAGATSARVPVPATSARRVTARRRSAATTTRSAAPTTRGNRASQFDRGNASRHSSANFGGGGGGARAGGGGGRGGGGRR